MYERNIECQKPEAEPCRPQEANWTKWSRRSGRACFYLEMGQNPQMDEALKAAGINHVDRNKIFRLIRGGEDWGEAVGEIRSCGRENLEGWLVAAVVAEVCERIHSGEAGAG